MKINAYIMANRTQEVPIPVPGEEITTGISWSMSNTTFHYKLRHMNGGTYQPLNEYTIATSTAYATANTWYENTGWLPVNFIADGNGCDLYAENSHAFCEADIQNIEGYVVLSGLSAGKYVVVLDHYIGGRSKLPYDDWYTFGMTDFHNEKTIRQDTNGIVYGELIGVELYDPDAGYDTGKGWVVHIKQMCNIEIAEGETSKTISYGGTAFAQSLFASSHHTALYGFGAFYAARFGLRTRVYTDGGNA